MKTLFFLTRSDTYVYSWNSYYIDDCCAIERVYFHDLLPTESNDHIQGYIVGGIMLFALTIIASIITLTMFSTFCMKMYKHEIYDDKCMLRMYIMFILQLH